MEIVKRVRAPLDHLCIRPLDTHTVVNRVRTRNAAILTFAMPIARLQPNVHGRYEVETFAHSLEAAGPAVGAADADAAATASGSAPSAPDAAGAAGAVARAALDSERPLTEDGRVRLGLVTMLVGETVPLQPQGLLERLLDPPPYPFVSLRISVMDRIHWQRSAWADHSICKSLTFGRIPHKIFGANIDYKNAVNIDCAFNAERRRYDSYRATVPGMGLDIELEDTGVGLLDRGARVTPGFLDNESALRQLALSREVVMKGVGGCVYRQPMWATPTSPNIARVVKCDVNGYFRSRFGCDAVFPQPLAAWLLDEVAETKIYQIEAQVEVENEPNTATHFGDRSLTERVQRKAMNRANDFREGIRRNTYADNAGAEQPR